MGTSQVKLRDQFNAAKDSLGCSPEYFVDESCWTIYQKGSIVGLRRDTHKLEVQFIDPDKFGDTRNISDAFCYWLDEMDIQYRLVCHVPSMSYYIMTADGRPIIVIDLQKAGIL